MATQTETRLTGILEKIAIGALFLIVGWQYNAQEKLEDRQFSMQGEMFTESKARVLEDRLNKNIDARFAESNTRIESLRSEMGSKLDILLGLQRNREGIR
ncbi:hypothetical protein D3C85_173280 [compost metagenome]